LQSIWGANDTLFVGAKNEADWNVYSVTGADTALSEVLSDCGMLNGVAHDGSNYYIATGKGIYVGTLGSFPDTVVEESDGNATGILNVNGVITAVIRYTTDRKPQGKILIYDGSKFNMISSGDSTYTGAMCVWNESGTEKLLLLGIEASGNYDNGYRELTLDSNGRPKTNAAQEPAIPGGDLSSVNPDSKSRYDTGLARYTVHHILQAPDDLVFVATAKNGVWVLDGDEGWNVVPKK
jgi:hypothetical protein